MLKFDSCSLNYCSVTLIVIYFCLLYLFYVTFCDITFLEYFENMYAKVETCDWDILDTTDRSTFVPLGQWY
jgi:hypothetical protein